MLSALCLAHPEKIPALLAKKIRALEKAQSEKPTPIPLEVILPKRQYDGPTRIAEIVSVVCQKYQISRNELVSTRRYKRLCQPRHLTYYLCRELTTTSFPMIGRLLGGRDHTTILHGCNKIDARMASNEELRKEVSELLEYFNAEIPA